MHIRSVRHQPKKTPPAAGPHKRNPQELEKILDMALEDSMSASDAVSTVMPEVKKYPEHPKR